MVTALQTNGHANDTLVIITAKHGQSPIDVTTRVGASDALYGGTPGMGTLGSFTTDDVGLVWLDPTLEKSQYKAAESYLLANAAALHIDTLVDKTGMSSLGFKNPFGDNRTPDFIAITHPGVIYTGGTKIAEHGGFAYNDHAVALLVSNPHIAPVTTGRPVFTRQVAPTILKALGIDPEQLDAVRKEGTRSLPSLGF
jgi:arylsulfatase A-like enzyme